MIQHRTKRAIYVVLLCVALLASGFSIYNQFASDNNASQLANQVAQACAENPTLAQAQGLDCEQAKDVQTDGPAIIQGPKGDPGPRGFTGDSGMNGRDGIAGAKGDTGVTGPQGATGATGQVGQTGATGEPGKEGPQGIPGPEGPQGPPGDRGADGDPGQDAPYIVDISFDDSTGQCLATFTFNEGNPIATPVNRLMCLGAK